MVAVGGGGHQMDLSTVGVDRAAQGLAVHRDRQQPRPAPSARSAGSAGLAALVVPARPASRRSRHRPRARQHWSRPATASSSTALRATAPYSLASRSAGTSATHPAIAVRAARPAIWPAAGPRPTQHAASSIAIPDSSTDCSRAVARSHFQHGRVHVEHRPAQAGVLASNSRGTAPAADEVRRAHQRFQGIVLAGRLAARQLDPARGVVRGMSSFHQAFHGSASNIVQSGDAELYMQVKRGAPGRIRTYATASGDR